MKNKLIVISLAMVFAHSLAWAQPPFADYSNLFVAPESYVVGHTQQQPLIDGKIDDTVWQKAAWSNLFVDIEGNIKPKPYHDTRVKMLWDSNYLYIAAELNEPHVWAKLTKHDEIVYHDNDFEIFINPENNGHRYFEIEVNALGTIFDLFLSKPYRAGGPALFSWNAPGMLHAVNVNGVLNNAVDKDKAWTVEFAIPFAAISMGNYANIPKDGELWRINFSRVQWEVDVVNGEYVKRKDKAGKILPENNWVWSPQGVIDMHRPERWGYIQFSKHEAGKELPTFLMPYTEKQRRYLWLVYYKQNDFFAKNKHYALSLEELGGLNDIITIDGVKNNLQLWASPHQFLVKISDTKTKPISLNNEGLVQ